MLIVMKGGMVGQLPSHIGVVAGTVRSPNPLTCQLHLMPGKLGVQERNRAMRNNLRMSSYPSFWSNASYLSMSLFYFGGTGRFSACLSMPLELACLP